MIYMQKSMWQKQSDEREQKWKWSDMKVEKSPRVEHGLQGSVSFLDLYMPQTEAGGAAPQPRLPQKLLLFIQGESVLIAFPCPCPLRTSSSPSGRRESSRVLDAVRNVLHERSPEIRRTRQTINTFIAGTLTLQAKQLGGLPPPPSPPQPHDCFLLAAWELHRRPFALYDLKAIFLSPMRQKKKGCRPNCSSYFHHIFHLEMSGKVLR